MTPPNMPGPHMQMDPQTAKKHISIERDRAIARRDILKARLEITRRQITSRRTLVDRVIEYMPVNQSDRVTALTSHDIAMRTCTIFALEYAEVATADADMHQLSVNEMEYEIMMLSQHIANCDDQLQLLSSGLIIAGPGSFEPRKN